MEASTSRMETAMDIPQPFLVDVRVDLRRRDVGVAEQLLDDAQVRAVAEQMCGEGMAQEVGVDLCLDPGEAGSILHDLPDAGGAEFPPPV